MTSAYTVSTTQIETFARDGVVKIPGLLEPDALEPVHALADRQLASPGEWVSDTNPGSPTNRLFTTRYLWQTDDTINDFVFNSEVGSVAGQVLQSSSARFYFDHLLVKEPHTGAPTPWHQDIPYWPFLGKQIASVWVSLTSTTVEQSSLEFIRGSHLWDKYYAPVNFDDEVEDWTADFEGEACPDIESARDDYDIVGFDVEPGDALIFSAWIVHGSPANAGTSRRVALSTRWLGDDAVFAPHPGCDPTVNESNMAVAPGCYPADDSRTPLVWTSSA